MLKSQNTDTEKKNLINESETFASIFGVFSDFASSC